jgi:hypothetical protein
MTDMEKVQAVLRGGGKYTTVEVSRITGIKPNQALSMLDSLDNVAYKEGEYYLPQHNASWVLFTGSMLVGFMIYLVTW